MDLIRTPQDAASDLGLLFLFWPLQLQILGVSGKYFSSFSIKIYVVGTH